ncbi:MAG: ATPase, partial [Clostridia bacterium]|nr:ATPase [Clostridia bacterium]
MGLGFSQVEQRKKEGQTNWKIMNTSKSYLQIVAENIFTFCNVVTFILVAMLFIIGEYSDTFSSLIIVCNIVVGSVQGIKAKNAVR